ERVRRLDLLATQAGLLGHDEHLERRARGERVHHPDEPGALDELRARDAVVDIDVIVVDQPALAGRVRLRVLDLAGDGLLFVTDAVLLGGLPRIDRSDHRVSSFLLFNVASCRRSQCSLSTRVTASWRLHHAAWTAMWMRSPP